MSNADGSIFVSQPSVPAATVQLSSRKGKMTKRMSFLKENTKNAGTKKLSAQSRSTSEDISDTVVFAQGKLLQCIKPILPIPPLYILAHLVRNNAPHTKSPWRVVEPSKRRARSNRKLATLTSRPRVWAGVRLSPISIHVPLQIPGVREQRRAISSSPCSCEKRGRRCMGMSRTPYARIFWALE
jgi:hypothetical protein